MNNQHEMTARGYDEYAFDTSPQPFKKWLEKRLKGNRRDAIDNLARRIIADVRIPRKASKSMYEAQMRAKKYSQADQATCETAWQQFKNETIGE